LNGDVDQTDMKPNPKLPKLRYINSVSNGRTVSQPGHLLLELFTIRLAVQGVQIILSYSPLTEDLETTTTSYEPVN
jgi:hypothetical protein